MNVINILLNNCRNFKRIIKSSALVTRNTCFDLQIYANDCFSLFCVLYFVSRLFLWISQWGNLIILSLINHWPKIDHRLHTDIEWQIRCDCFYFRSEDISASIVRRRCWKRNTIKYFIIFDANKRFIFSQC